MQSPFLFVFHQTMFVFTWLCGSAGGEPPRTPLTIGRVPVGYGLDLAGVVPISSAVGVALPPSLGGWSASRVVGEGRTGAVEAGGLGPLVRPLQ